MLMELVSAIVITYKRPIDVLKRAVCSVLNQSYRAIELIVVNDASDEIVLKQQIQDMLSELDDGRIVYICHEMNMGANAARNTGLKASKGRFVAFLDDDDEWLPEKIEKQMNVCTQSDDIGMVYCGFTIRGDSGDVSRKTKIVDEPSKFLPALLENNFIGSTSFPLLRKDTLLQVGGFDTEQVSCQEYELWIRIAQISNIIGIDEPLGRYYVSSDSTFKSNYAKYVAGDERIINKHRQLFEKNRISYGNHLLNMALNMAVAKQYRFALKYKLLAWKGCPFNPNNLLPVLLVWRVRNKA